MSIFIHKCSAALQVAFFLSFRRSDRLRVSVLLFSKQSWGICCLNDNWPTDKVLLCMFTQFDNCKSLCSAFGCCSQNEWLCHQPLRSVAATCHFSIWGQIRNRCSSLTEGSSSNWRLLFKERRIFNTLQFLSHFTDLLTLTLFFVPFYILPTCFCQRQWDKEAVNGSMTCPVPHAAVPEKVPLWLKAAAVTCGFMKRVQKAQRHCCCTRKPGWTINRWWSQYYVI